MRYPTDRVGPSQVRRCLSAVVPETLIVGEAELMSRIVAGAIVVLRRMGPDGGSAAASSAVASRDGYFFEGTGGRQRMPMNICTSASRRAKTGLLSAVNSAP